MPGVVTLEPAAAPATQRAEGTRRRPLVSETLPWSGRRRNSGVSF